MAGVTLAQPPHVAIPATPTCAACTIEMVKLVTVGSPNDPLLLGDWSHLGRGPRNTFVASSFDGGQLLVFDSAGRYLRAIGRRGQGPGEFSQPPVAHGLGAGDTLYVRSAGWMSLFSPELAYVRTFTLPPGPYMSLTPLPNGNTIYASSRLVSGGGSALTILGPQGYAVSSFGLTGYSDPAACIRCFANRVTLATNRRGILVSHPNRYVVELFDLSGTSQLIASIVNSPWMSDWDSDPNPATTYTERPRPTIVGAFPASEGRAWLVGNAPAANWAAPGPPQGEGVIGLGLRGGGITYVVPRNSQASRDRASAVARNTATVVELVDLQRGQVVASRRFEGEVFTPVDGEFFSVRRHDANGVTTFDVYRVVFRER
jgi:hypothetical protein